MYKWLNDQNPSAIYKLYGKNELTKYSILEVDLKFPTEYKDLEKRVKSEPLIYEVLKDCRKAKTPQELELLKFMSDATNKAHIEIMKNIKVGMWERDVENIFNNYCADNYYTRLWGYPCIGGSGCNGAILHYDINDKEIDVGDLFLADMGMRFCNYTTDVTITIPANGKFTPEQKEIYDLVLKANRDTQKIVKSGVTMSELNTCAVKIILQGLQALGFLVSNVTVDELFNNNVHYSFMPHGIGHHVGIEVHDVCKVSYKEDLIEENNIVTVEPGIYFRPMLLDQAFANQTINKYFVETKVKSYYKFGGIRIEDDLIVTKEGSINMNADLPRTTEDIEKLMNKV
jgi:Xaa-Pro dipeptidase